MQQSIFLKKSFLGLALSCLAAFCACSSHNPNEYSEAFLKTRELSRRYGTIEGNFAASYLAYVKDRLLDALPPQMRRREDYEIVLLAAQDPMAFSPGGGILVLSRGLIRNLGNEAELAFVLAHEISHDNLQHTEAMFNNNTLGHHQQELELDADRSAVGMMALAGYDPRISIHAIQNAYFAQRVRSSGPPAAQTHPQAIERTKALLTEISAAGWRPPGTVNRREFVKLQKLLAEAKWQS